MIAFIPLQQQRVIDQSHDPGGLVVDEGNGSEPEVLVEEALDDWVVLAQSDMHDHGAL